MGIPVESKKHWYTDGESEKCAFECPEGWHAGRIPKIGEASSKRMKEHNPMHTMTTEQLEARAAKIHQYNLNRSIEQIKHKSEAISKANKGKLKGNIPWNKGKKGVQQAWNRGIKTGHSWNFEKEMSAESREKLSKALKGRIPWNKNLKIGPLSEECKMLREEKQYQTKKLHNSFNSSTPEECYYQYLLSKYSEEDIIRQYRDSRYPFNCDFYIKSLDKFIELNLSWTHGGHPFDSESIEDKKLLQHWQQKAENSDYYKNAIYTWTDLDIRKASIARENKLNYEVIYSYDQ